MFITLGEAAGQSGLSKSTLSRAIRDGKISAERSADTKSYRIEAAELQRYLDATAVLRASTTAPESHSATPLEQPLSAARKAQIEGLKQVAETCCSASSTTPWSYGRSGKARFSNRRASHCRRHSPQLPPRHGESGGRGGGRGDMRRHKSSMMEASRRGIAVGTSKWRNISSPAAFRAWRSAAGAPGGPGGGRADMRRHKPPTMEASRRGIAIRQARAEAFARSILGRGATSRSGARGQHDRGA